MLAGFGARNLEFDFKNHGSDLTAFGERERDPKFKEVRSKS